MSKLRRVLRCCLKSNGRRVFSTRIGKKILQFLTPGKVSEPSGLALSKVRFFRQTQIPKLVVLLLLFGASPAFAMDSDGDLIDDSIDLDDDNDGIPDTEEGDGTLSGAPDYPGFKEFRLSLIHI